MTRHYYTREAGESFETFQISIELAGRRFGWTSAEGVFAKDGLDPGSRLLLETAALPERGRVLDLGCGTGPIGLLASMDAPDRWTCLVDVTERAVHCAGLNTASVAPAGGAAVVQGSFLDAFRAGSFSAVLFNPPIRVGKAVLLQVLEEVPRVLVPGGTLWMVVRLQQGARSYRAHLERVFGAPVDVAARRKGYLVLRAEAPRTDISTVKNSPAEDAPVAPSRDGGAVGRDPTRQGTPMSFEGISSVSPGTGGSPAPEGLRS